MSENSKMIEPDALAKALADIQELAKGHSSRGTSTTKVEEDAGEAAASQVCVGGDSARGEWPGGKQEAAGGDNIEENGTDYNGAAAMAKSVFTKLAKGEALTAEEMVLAKAAGMCKGDDEDDEEEEVEEEAMKSLFDHAKDNEAVRKGFEVSDFLTNFADVVSKAITSSESRVVSRVLSALSKETESQGDFQKSLASALSNFAEVTTLQAQRIEQVESSPARGPKSHMRALEKSFSGDSGDQLSKSQISDTLVDMVQKGLCSATEVVRYETTSHLPAPLRDKMVAHRNGR
tara:strand:- start:9118 stop:9987 length:870 start_codon:yes stop_codon:yes gene_type:complete